MKPRASTLPDELRPQSFNFETGFYSLSQAALCSQAPNQSCLSFPSAGITGPGHGVIYKLALVHAVLFSAKRRDADCFNFLYAQHSSLALLCS